MQVDENSSRKYVFVCGLARSGTSLLGRNIARLKDCSGFTNTGVFEDEGQFVPARQSDSDKVVETGPLIDEAESLMAENIIGALAEHTVHDKGWQFPIVPEAL